MNDLVTTRWSPDTCECVIEYQWERNSAAETRVHTPSATIKHCDHHKGLDLHQHWAVLQDENPRKNKMVGYLMEKHGIKLEDIRWNFDQKRVLHVFTPQLTIEHRGTAQTHADITFGRGKVVMH